MSDHMVPQQQPGLLDAALSGLLVRSGRRDNVAFTELYAALRADVHAQVRVDERNRHNGAGRRFLADYDSHSERELSAVLSSSA